MNNSMRFKIVFSFLWWTGSFALLFLWDLSYWQFLLLYIFHGLSQVLMALGIAHDANHSAISSKPRINKLFSYAFDICGVSSFNWRAMHNRGHHHCINVHGEDIALAKGGTIRMSTKEPKQDKHKYQHIYVWFLYSLYTLDYVFVRDFKYIFSKNISAMKNVRSSKVDIFTIFTSKIFYLGYMIVIPSIFLDFSVWLILAAFVITHLITGLIMLLTFQTSHIVHDTTYSESKDEHRNFFEHVFATTSDYGLKNRLFTWYVGGLNLHVIHNFAPGICHINYPALTHIVQSTADEFNVNYRQNRSLVQVVVSHYKLLKGLGKEN